MHINIGDADDSGSRKVTVTDGTTTLAEFTAADTIEAHKLLKRGRKDGWETLSEQTRAATDRENVRIDAGKAAAEPKKAK